MWERFQTLWTESSQFRWATATTLVGFIVYVLNA